jgi:hypothetical protein
MKGMKDTMAAMESMNKTAGKGTYSKSFDQAKRSIEEANNSLKKFENNMESIPSKAEQAADGFTVLKGAIAGAVGGLAVAGIGAALDFMTQQIGTAIQGASDLQEVQNVIDVTFGKSAGAINEWSKTMLESAGLSELTALQFVGNMGSILSAAGLPMDAVMGMSKAVTQLSGDMASFRNIGTDIANEKIVAGILGEFEPLRSVGVVLSETTLQAYMMEKGLKGTYSTMDEASKIMLRFAFIQEKTNLMQGDFVRTSDSFSNQQRLLTENWKQFTMSVGKLVIPTLANLMIFINANIIPALYGFTDAVAAMIAFVTDNSDKIIGAFTAIATVILLKMVPAMQIAIANYVRMGTAAMVSAAKQAAAFVAANWQLLALGAVIFVLIGYWDELGNLGRAVLMSIAAALLIVQLAALGVTWPFLLIIGIIAAVGIAFWQFGDIATTVMGIIVGTTFALAAAYANMYIGIANGAIAVWEWLYNGFQKVAAFLKNLFNEIKMIFLTVMKVVVSGVEAAVNWIYDKINDVINGAIDGINKLIGAMKNIPGLGDLGEIGHVEIGGKTGGAMTNAIDAMIADADTYKAEANEKDFGSIDYFNLGKAFETGQKLGVAGGKAIQSGIGKLTSAVGSLTDVEKKGQEKTPEDEKFDINKLIDGIASGEKDKLKEGGTVKVGNDVSLTDEDLRNMRESAKLDYVNKFMTLKPNMTVAFGDVRESADVNQIMSVLEDMFENAKATALIN